MCPNICNFPCDRFGPQEAHQPCHLLEPKQTPEPTSRNNHSPPTCIQRQLHKQILSCTSTACTSVCNHRNVVAGRDFRRSPGLAPAGPPQAGCPGSHPWLLKTSEEETPLPPGQSVPRLQQPHSTEVLPCVTLAACWHLLHQTDKDFILFQDKHTLGQAVEKAFISNV